jgi:hypothetical protein
MGQQKVDVLAVLDDAAAELQKSRGQGVADDVRRARAAIAELIESAKRTTAAFRAIGANKAPVVPAALRIDAEAAILALDAALSTTEGGR